MIHPPYTGHSTTSNRLFWSLCGTSLIFIRAHPSILRALFGTYGAALRDECIAPSRRCTTSRCSECQVWDVLPRLRDFLNSCSSFASSNRDLRSGEPPSPMPTTVWTVCALAQRLLLWRPDQANQHMQVGVHAPMVRGSNKAQASVCHMSYRATTKVARLTKIYRASH